jgi:predicted CoA-substrate-specific enzyme activase
MHLGIDVGTISVKVACLDDAGRAIELKGPARHEGRPAKALVSLLREQPLAEVRSAAVTGAGRLWVSAALGIPAVNGLRALSRAFARLHPQVRTVIEIGGHDSKLIVMRELHPGEEPVAVDASRSSMCAAGTGSFLDQQATRLGFTPESLGAQAMKSEKPANVSGRCSVFAKSDLIHLQQIGTRDYDMLAGLCYAVVRTFRSSVAKGRKIEKPVALCGGVALNECVRRAVKDVFELDAGGAADEFVLPENPDFTAALGCGLVAMESDGEGAPSLTEDRLAKLEEFARDAAVARRLTPLEKPTFPASTERKIHPLPAGGKTRGFLGVDIGSISTKAAVVDEEGRVVARRYFWTAGRPIEAVRRAMKEIGEEVADRVEIAGVGTTGSGRYLVGDFIGADVIKNEITAQAMASIAFDPEVDTVFEIGGQDSKFIVIRDGTVVDFEMNKVCAAGTGSFLNEQAERMKIEIEKQFSDLAFASGEPVDCGERCTVFMETDVSNYLASGCSVEDLSSGLAYSIAKNYLTKVADRAKVGKCILFQGAVAYNDAVVAAFEKETGQKVRVTPDNEITGCIGVALIARDAAAGKSGFRGFREIAEKDYEQSVFTCARCENRCDVRKVTIEGRPALFYGDRCDRYQTERRAESDLPDLFEERTSWLLHDYVPEPESGPVVGIPRALSFFEVLPFWRTLLRELGVRTVLSSPTTRGLMENAADYMTTESCMPVKAAHGHVLDLIERKPDFIFLPTLVDRPRPKKEEIFRFNCPFVQVWGHVARAGIDPAEHGIKVLDPIVYYTLGPKVLMDQLGRVADALGAPKRRLKRAIRAAQAAQDEYARRMRERGREILADLPGGRAVVLVGRPYNTGDPGLNLDLPKKLRKMDILPIPIDMMPVEKVDVLARWPNMFWYYGRMMLAASDLVGDDDRLDLVYVTNFRCGPDSFITKYVPEAAKGKPYLVLEFDDHSADAGAVTRIEAFLDSRRSRSKSDYAPVEHKPFDPSRRDVTVYMPHMGDFMYGIAAAARAFDIDIRVIDTDRTSFEHGLGYSSGKECLPYVLCVGNIAKTVAKPDFDRDHSAFFMASSGGPCRFGQYEHGMRRVLDELGYPDVPVISLHQSKDAFSQLPSMSFAKHVFVGLVAAAELERLSRQIRPYEAEPGSTDRAYKEATDVVCRALERGKKPYRALEEAAGIFLAVKTEERDLPVIYVVGENYVRNQPFANCDVARKIEGLGGEAVVPTFMEWVHHVNHCVKILSHQTMGPLKRLGLALTRKAMADMEQKVERALGSAWRDTYVPHIERLWENALRADFVPFFGDGSLAVGLAIEMAELGVRGRPVGGVVNVMPFTCMPGSIARSQLRRAAKLLGGVPVLDVEFDGRGDDLLREELDMFMEQVKERHRMGSHSRPSPRPARADIDQRMRSILRL